MEDEPLAIEYNEAEAGTLPVPHLPPETPAVTPMLYADALCGRTQDLPDIEYYKPKQSHSAYNRVAICASEINPERFTTIGP